MSCISKIKHAYPSLTLTQRLIGDYILLHHESILKMSVQELAFLTTTSPAAIVRFSRKIGYDGFLSLKYELASDIHRRDEYVFDDQIEYRQTFNTFLKKEQRAYIDTIRRTFELINANTLENVIELACKARRIYLIGLGASAHICSDLLMKLTRIDAPVIFFQDADMQVDNSIHLTSEDIVIAISYRGNTDPINLAVKKAKQNKTITIAITQNIGSVLSNLADIVLPVPSEEDEVRLGAITSRNATQVITDLIYLGMSKNKFE